FRCHRQALQSIPCHLPFDGRSCRGYLPHRQSPPTLPYSPERESLDASTDRAGCRRIARSWRNRRAGIPRDPNIMISLFCSGHILVALTAILGRGVDENQVPTTAALPDGSVPVG